MTEMVEEAKAIWRQLSADAPSLEPVEELSDEYVEPAQPVVQEVAQPVPQPHVDTYAVVALLEQISAENLSLRFENVQLKRLAFEAAVEQSRQIEELRSPRSWWKKFF